MADQFPLLKQKPGSVEWNCVLAKPSFSLIPSRDSTNAFIKIRKEPVPNCLHGIPQNTLTNLLLQISQKLGGAPYFERIPVRRTWFAVSNFFDKINKGNVCVQIMVLLCMCSKVSSVNIPCSPYLECNQLISCPVYTQGFTASLIQNSAQYF